MGGKPQFAGLQHARRIEAAVEVRAYAPRVRASINISYEDPKDKRQYDHAPISYDWAGWDVDEQMAEVAGHTVVLLDHVREGRSMTDDLKNIVGDGLARVSAGIGAGEKDYGNGVDVSVMVTLTCDQSREGVDEGFELAAQLGEFFTEKLFERGVEVFRRLSSTGR
jgi:hypothetical protein